MHEKQQVEEKTGVDNKLVGSLLDNIKSYFLHVCTCDM